MSSKLDNMRFALKTALWTTLALSGCASELASNPYQPLNTDVQQRALISGPTTGYGAISTSHGMSSTKSMTVICAEPLPDTPSAHAYADAPAGSLPVQDKTAPSLGGCQSATAGDLRTQAIKLHRDSLYRLCESYANHALTDSQYQRLSQRYQEQLAALLAIEELTSCRGK